jgi:hypothetical protein
MRTIGRDVTEQDVIAGLGTARISPTYGLLDASGAGLVSYLAEQGIAADNNPDASWQQVQDAAGWQPMLIGGRAWCHWVAVRMGTDALATAGLAPPTLSALALMNPASGYMGISQVLYEPDYAALGPFSAVWFTAW